MFSFSVFHVFLLKQMMGTVSEFIATRSEAEEEKVRLGWLRSAMVLYEGVTDAPSGRECTRRAARTHRVNKVVQIDVIVPYTLNLWWPKVFHINSDIRKFFLVRKFSRNIGILSEVPTSSLSSSPSGEASCKIPVESGTLVSGAY